MVAELGWGDGSASLVLGQGMGVGGQVRGCNGTPEFNPQNPCLKSQMWWHALVIPVLGNQRYMDL